MDVAYITRDTVNKKELELLHRAENDKQNSSVHTYTNHRDILGR